MNYPFGDEFPAKPTATAQKMFDDIVSQQPPEGHRLLADGETILVGDKFLEGKKWFFVHPGAYHIGKKWEAELYKPFARKIEVPEVSEYQQEMWTVPKDVIYGAIEAIHVALGYMPLIKTDVPQWQRTVELDIVRMQDALAKLRKLNSSS